MISRHGTTGEAGRPRDRERDEAAGLPGTNNSASADESWRPARKPGKHAAQGPPDRGQGQPDRTEAASRPAEGHRSPVLGAEPVARRTATGWRVGDEEVSDLTSAMVLADLLAADLSAERTPAPSSPAPATPAGDEPPDARKLEQTVAQLEHALTARVRVEQAIGVLAERHRLRPRQAFELLRSVARAQGRRVLEMATEVVDSATNPLLRIPEELAKPPLARRRGRVRAGWQPERP